MKLIRACFVFIAILIAATFSYAQTQPFAGAKIGIVNTAAFSEDKIGITRLVNAYKSLDLEFKPRQDELNTIAAQLDKLAKDLRALQDKLNNPNPAVPIDKAAIQAEIENKNDEGARLQLTAKRKQEDAKAQYEKRSAVVIDPIRRDIGNAIAAFANARGIDMILDGVKLEDAGILLSANKSVDLTEAFIKDYNSKTAGVPVKK